MSSQSFTESRWNLGDILPAASGPELDKILDDLENRARKFESNRARLTDQMPEGEFLEIMRQSEEIQAIERRLDTYAELWFAQDTRDPAALTFKRKIQKLVAEVTNRTLFFSLWWKALNNADAERLLAHAGEYSYPLQTERLFQPHTLSEAEEQIINLKDVSGINGVITLYEMITSGYEFTPKIGGKKKAMTRGELQSYVRDPDARVRAAAYQELLRVFGDQGTLLAQVYAYRVQDWESEKVRLRHFESPIAARNLQNDIPDAVIDTLLRVCRANRFLFQRFFRLKAKWLGMRKLRRYDIYAPVGTSEKKYPYKRAVEMVLDSYSAFSPMLGDMARSVFEQQHVDSELRHGKLDGAFCASVLPSIAPYVLLNYAGREKDVSTMAHELGHAVHSLLAKDHSVLTFHPTLPLAETASVFGEMLMMDRLQGIEKDAGMRRYLRATQLDDAYATIMRQAYFILFEREAHSLITGGKSEREVCAAYMVNLREQFGDSVEIGDEFKWEWVSIPHIYHTPFYTYAYAFGNLLTLALYQQYRAEGELFKPRYFQILSTGGSAKPAQILSDAGIDMTSEAFWQGGFDVMKGWLGELEAITSATAKSPRKRKTVKRSH